MKHWFIGLSWLITAAVGTAQAGSDFEVGTVVSVNNRALSVDLDVGLFKVRKRLFIRVREQLTPGVKVRYKLDFSNEAFPYGVISRLEIVEQSIASCPPLCL